MWYGNTKRVKSIGLMVKTWDKKCIPVYFNILLLLQLFALSDAKYSKIYAMIYMMFIGRNKIEYTHVSQKKQTPQNIDKYGIILNYVCIRM